MNIKFGLPNGAGGMAAAHGSVQVKKHLRAFEKQTNCTIRTWSFRKDYRHWIGCEIPKNHEMFFAIFMCDKQVFMRYELLEEDEPNGL